MTINISSMTSYCSNGSSSTTALTAGTLGLDSTQIYQLKLKFTLPSGLSASAIKSATLTFSASSNSTSDYIYHICAPNSTTEQTNYQRYSTTTVISRTIYSAFNRGTAGGTTKSYTVTITNVLQQCLTVSQGWMTILVPRDVSEGNRTITISGTPYITYELANTVRVVNSNGTGLDLYQVYVVENNALVPYRVTVVNSNGTALENYT